MVEKTDQGHDRPASALSRRRPTWISSRTGRVISAWWRDEQVSAAPSPRRPSRHPPRCRPGAPTQASPCRQATDGRTRERGDSDRRTRSHHTAGPAPGRTHGRSGRTGRAQRLRPGCAGFAADQDHRYDHRDRGHARGPGRERLQDLRPPLRRGRTQAQGRREPRRRRLARHRRGDRRELRGRQGRDLRRHGPLGLGQVHADPHAQRVVEADVGDCAPRRAGHQRRRRQEAP